MFAPVLACADSHRSSLGEQELRFRRKRGPGCHRSEPYQAALRRDPEDDAP